MNNLSTKIEQYGEKYTFAETMFLLGVFFKQFYIFDSGSIQIGDCFFFISILAFLFRKRKIALKRDDLPYLFFVLCTFLINTIYTLVYKKQFLISSVYYLYNFLIILSFSSFISSELFLNKLRLVFQLDLITQVLVYFLNIGRWLGNYRFQGTFNDPNQFGFFVFACFLGIYLLLTNKKKAVFWFIIWLFLTVLSVSAGMMAALFLFVFFYLVFNTGKMKKGVVLMLIIILLFCGIVFISYLLGILKLPAVITNSRIYARLIGKLNMAGIGSQNGSLYTIVKERQWNRVFEYPEFILIGAGEGYFERFGTYLEIHSSILGPLFYYGIVSCSFLVYWIKKKLYNIDRIYYCVYLALILESFTLVHNRQPFFWMLFVLASLPQVKKVTAN